MCDATNPGEYDDPARELLARFTEPGPEFGPLPIWWWSGATLTRDRLRWQMEQLVAQGVRQAVVLCLAPTGPLFGSLADDPPFLSPKWIELLDQVCADAEQLGFTIWMYDQIGFSGANLQGRLTAHNPDFAGLALFRTSVDSAGAETTVECPPQHTALAAYAITAHDGQRVDLPVADGGARWSGPPARVTLIHSGVSGFDYFGERACAALLDQVHGELERTVGHWFGRAIGGFFQDELPAMPTWGRQFAETFHAVYGYELAPRLWALYEGADAGEADAEAARVRRDYHEHRARLARRAFFDPQQAWFAKHDLICGFDQPTPAREGDPVGGVHVYGDYLGTHSGYGAPGSDHWGDSKVHSSLAHAHGRPRTWIEAFHSSGWGGTLEETYDWLAPFLRRGATLYDPHAVYYSTVGGWWEWAPPSTCWRQPYWPSYHVFATAVARLCSVLTVGTHVCDTLLLSPTSTAQAYLTLDGPLAPAERSAARYHELNGVSAWFAEKRGVLERAGIDHDVVDETTLASGTVVDGGLRVGAETYRTVILPEAHALHVAAAHTLVRFAAAGGRVVCVGRPPRLFLGAADAGETAAALFAEAVADGRIRVVDTADQAPDAVAAGPVRVSADAPFLLRRHGDVHVLMLVAHDETSGTAAPIVSLRDAEDWWATGFPWDEYWAQLRENGYRFVPPGARRARVRVEGVTRPRAQRWNPRTGDRTELPVVEGPDGSWLLDVSFADGSIALVVLGEHLPEANRQPLGAITGTRPIPGPWQAAAESTLDNQWGDLGAAERTGVLPIEVWRLDHAVGTGLAVPENADWQPVTASFGPFAEVRGPWADGDEPAAGWQPVEWSLSRGIRDDPGHSDTLGPKGYVPEEFLDWREVPAGASVAVRTRLTLPDRPANRFLAVGANAVRQVTVDGVPVSGEGDGYQSFHPLPADSAGRTVSVEIELRAERTGPVRASFAVVTDPTAYRRPEWLLAEPGPAGASTDLTVSTHLTEIPADTTIQVASDGPCSVLVNGVEVGRQGDFNPYPGFREVRVHPYDIRAQLRTGDNVITLRVTNTGEAPTATALDSAPPDRGGLGLVSGAGWQAQRDGATATPRLHRHHPRDPRFICAWARPHPLPGASWLEPAAAGAGVVEPIVPDLAPGTERVEWLRLAAPLGTTALRIPSTLDVSVLVDGQEHAPDTQAGNWVRLPAPLSAGTPVLLRVRATDGRRGGALLDAAIEVEVTAATTRLASWEELGLRALGGQVRYRTTVRLTEAEAGATRTVLDLGEVRGTADVLVNGTLTDRLVWGPWTSEITGAARPGDNEIEIVVRGTLAGYLDDASPTAGVVAGQVRTGLFGPVRLVHHEVTATSTEETA